MSHAHDAELGQHSAGTNSPGVGVSDSESISSDASTVYLVGESSEPASHIGLPDHLFGHIVSRDLCASILDQFAEKGVISVNRPLQASSAGEAASGICWDLWDRQEGVDEDCVASFLNDVAKEAFQATKRLGRLGSRTPGYRFSSVAPVDLQLSLPLSQRRIKPDLHLLLLPLHAYQSDPVNSSPPLSFDSDETAVDDAVGEDTAMALSSEARAKQERNWKIFGGTHFARSHAEAASDQPEREKRRHQLASLGKLLLPWRLASSTTNDGAPHASRPVATKIPASRGRLQTRTEYINPTQTRIIGAYREAFVDEGIPWLHQSLPGLLRAQPWNRFGLGLSISGYHKEYLQVSLLRADQSGTEADQICLCEHDGALDFIQVVLGLVLASDTDLGADPSMVLGERNQVRNSGSLDREDVLHVERFIERIHLEHGGNTVSCLVSHLVSAAPLIPGPGTRVWAASWDGGEETWQALSGSAEGSDHLALSMTWHTADGASNEEAMIQKATEKPPPPQLILPIKRWLVETKGAPTSTVHTIRNIFGDDWNAIGIENRILQISIMPGHRPLSAFTSLREVVLALLDAIKGHEFLCKIGILHGNINEGSIALARDPRTDGPHGYLIGLDMASHVPGPDTGPRRVCMPRCCYNSAAPGAENMLPGPDFSMDSRPWMAIDVLMGEIPQVRHDLESFFWVLFLFLFSYDRALLPGEPEDSRAHAQPWPAFLQSWKEQDAFHTSWVKNTFFSKRDAVLQGFHDSGGVHYKPVLKSESEETIVALIGAFHEALSTPTAGRYFPNEDVSHSDIYPALQTWLASTSKDC